MTRTGNWKKALLESSMPLEFEASRVLVSWGFSVNADFKYAWSDSEAFKDAAVDLHAVSALPFANRQEAEARIELLINCESRHPDVLWMFLPDPNRPEFSPGRSGAALRVIDQFSPFVISPEPSAAFDAGLTLCFRGVEIDAGTGETPGSSYKKSLSQLQNALPRLFTENTLECLTGPTPENRPFLFCPVLLTTAPLYVIQRDVELADIQAAESVTEIGDPHPFLVLYSDYSPDFKARCMDESSVLKDLLRTDEAMEIEMKKVRYYNSHSNLPLTIIDAVTSGQYAYLNAFFTRFIVCSLDGFPQLVDALKQAADDALATRIAV